MRQRERIVSHVKCSSSVCTSCSILAKRILNDATLGLLIARSIFDSRSASMRSSSPTSTREVSLPSLHVRPMPPSILERGEFGVDEDAPFSALLVFANCSIGSPPSADDEGELGVTVVLSPLEAECISARLFTRGRRGLSDGLRWSQLMMEIQM